MVLIRAIARVGDQVIALITWTTFCLLEESSVLFFKFPDEAAGREVVALEEKKSRKLSLQWSEGVTSRTQVCDDIVLGNSIIYRKAR